MYYSNGNYEAFADAQKPAGVDNKSAYVIGSGLAGLAAAVFLIRDAKMKGEKIHILEELPVALPQHFHQAERTALADYQYRDYQE